MLWIYEILVYVPRVWPNADIIVIKVYQIRVDTHRIFKIQKWALKMYKHLERMKGQCHRKMTEYRPENSSRVREVMGCIPLLAAKQYHNKF